MEPIKDAGKVQKMFAQGQPFLIDSQSGYKYSMVSRCPKDGSYAAVAQIERAGESLKRVVFECTSCFNRFEVKQDKILIH